MGNRAVTQSDETKTNTLRARLRQTGGAVADGNKNRQRYKKAKSSVYEVNPVTTRGKGLFDKYWRSGRVF